MFEKEDYYQVTIPRARQGLHAYELWIKSLSPLIETLRGGPRDGTRDKDLSFLDLSFLDDRDLSVIRNAGQTVLLLEIEWGLRDHIDDTIRGRSK